MIYIAFHYVYGILVVSIMIKHSPRIISPPLLSITVFLTISPKVHKQFPAYVDLLQPYFPLTL